MITVGKPSDKSRRPLPVDGGFATGRLLDVGCGHGFNAAMSNRRVPTIGIDRSIRNIMTCVDRYPEVSFVVMDAENIGFRDMSFFKISCYDVLEHVDDPEAVLHECARLATLGGTIDLIVPDRRSEALFRRLRPTYMEDIGHQRIFDSTSLKFVVEKTGLQVNKISPEGFLNAVYLALVLLFRRGSGEANGDTSIFDWRSHWLHAIIHLIFLHFDPIVSHTPLRFSPLIVLTVPIGRWLDRLGSTHFPKSTRLIAVRRA